MTQQPRLADDVGGSVEPGFEAVAEAFAENFATRGELGAAFAATLDGRPVVDLWGGVADAIDGRPWQEDTTQTIFSGTKGLTALCMAMLVDRGQLALDDPVARHWPEFAAEGKEGITVAEVLSHRGRLPGVRVPTKLDDLAEPRLMAERLAAQAPESDPRAAYTYHPLTYGWLAGELLRRIDGRTIGRFLAEEVAGPLGLELWIGLPPEQEPRVARLAYGPEWGKSVEAQEDPFPGDELWASIWLNPFHFTHPEPVWSGSRWRRAEAPGANGVGTARSIARLYGALARGGELDGVRLLSAQTLAHVTAPLAEGVDELTGEPMRYAAGFKLQSERRPFGPAALAFGHDGAGGSTHGAWPEQRVGFSYAMNEMRDDPDGDPRSEALLGALHDCLPV
jgi:CubicO group peptidase (beta-lactamase class C family)